MIPEETSHQTLAFPSSCGHPCSLVDEHLSCDHGSGADLGERRLGWRGPDHGGGYGGIAHPSGYPLYLLLARLFQFLPLGGLAFRTNLMSAVFTVLAAVLIHGTVTRHLPPGRTIPTALAGMTAGYTFGLAPLIWSQAVITEVYALQAFLVMLIITLYTRSVPASAPKVKALDRWRGLALGLATGNHLTTLLLVPMALLLGSFQRRAPSPDPGKSWLGNYKFDLSSRGQAVTLVWRRFVRYT
ncbi:MAG: DUF2723 domain-containing protein [Comamonadaceae bacterium]|nr:DUF2723 domain-containing protein [Comamonadaceae bacterium]